MPDSKDLPIELLARQLCQHWPAIEKTRREAELCIRRISVGLVKGGPKPSSEDADLVVFGSLARGEWTDGSDVDWTFLVDGQVAAEHRRTATRVSDRLAFLGFTAPGTTGPFGDMTFSHDLVHFIGGESDTNRNTTQRILLLLESLPVPFDRSSGETQVVLGAHGRVIRAILNRYLIDDSSFASEEGVAAKVPRFLLNDIVRFWRTMCVDFAWKEWEQTGKKWALRNIKLRMSRKLIFVAGLLICFSCYENKSLQIGRDISADESREAMLSHLLQYVNLSPLDILCDALLQHDYNGVANRLLSSYDDFLKNLNETDTRDKLEQLRPQDAYTDKIFLKMRAISNEFQSALTEWFFDSTTPLREFNRKYGVF